eukprot:CAMPEP_0202977564 /NCGR_PEP_ID=MMETSP1396-20130829/84317_1 /ASSEMBLY_ACC=CAM_ASM_000872 /TAXON_ID= /ORGANISM="Pseudokeronopsis sp., Strain Brazil" /LENGTH=140 /DNA_ID=CAMNT_0049716321 /DNA_START=316 /DNA_END=738 /DNA_ORIENTATION=-
MQADIMVVGMHGRKGPKHDPTVLGSAVQYLSINPVTPFLIIKDKKLRSDKPGGSFRWAVCIDGSDKSLHNPVTPFLIIKDKKLRSDKPGGSFRWAVCIDGSDKSLHAFDQVGKIMRKNDSLVVIVVQTSTVDPDRCIEAA